MVGYALWWCQADLAAMPLDDGADKRQAQTGTGNLSALIGLEHSRAGIGIETWAFIGDHDGDLSIVT